MTTAEPPSSSAAAASTAALSAQLIAAGALFHQRGWVPATGGNFSARLSSDALLITASGWHKGELSEAAFMVVDLHGRPADAGRTSSYETLLHCALYRRMPQVGCVLHTHSVANTLLSRGGSAVSLQGYELLKVFAGVTTHDHRVEIPVFGNDQDIARLAAHVDAHLQARPETPAYLLEGHGVYVWGSTVAQARHRVEALEFMLECELRSLETRR